MLRSCTVLIVCGCLFAPCVGSAQTIFVDEDFESYGSQGAFEAVWAPVSGNGLEPASGGGTLLSGVEGASADGTGVGAAVSGPAGLVNEHVDGFSFPNNLEGFLIAPSETESIVMRGDMFIDVENGPFMRQTIGLRGDIFDRSGAGDLGTNFVELGTWNGDVCLPTVDADACSGGDPDATPPVEPDPEFRGETDLAFRLVLFDFDSLGNYFENGVDQGQMVRGPNWQYFPLKEGLDSESTVLPNGVSGNGDGTADLADIGSGWHTYEAVISDDSVTLTLDLFRDGIDNSTGAPGVDSEVVVEIAMAANFDAPPFDFDPSPMNSFRIGAPSGISSLNGDQTVLASFDNLYLALETAAEPLIGDYNGDGFVDAADYTVYRDTLGDSVDVGTGADGNGNGVVDPGDYGVWAAAFGSASSVAVPEPSTALLVAAGLAVIARRR